MYFLKWAAYQVHTTPLWVIALYIIGINLLTFLAYRHDKQAAIDRSRRISEAWLHCLMFIGGTIGAVIAQRVIRHKTRKKSFRLKFWILLIMQIVIIIYIITAFD